MKKGAELALNFMLRLVFGMIAIFLINGYLQEKGLDACVGINALSALTSGFLGLPGVALLYGVRVVFDGVKIHKDLHTEGLSKTSQVTFKGTILRWTVQKIRSILVLPSGGSMQRHLIPVHTAD